MDNRLDFISKFFDHDAAVNEMAILRREFMILDTKLKGLQERTQKLADIRCIALARTNLEVALSYGIKSLCLIHEAVE